MSKSKPETALVASIMDYLTRVVGAKAIRVNAGLTVFKADSGSRRVIRGAAPGTSDIIACLPGGAFLGVECKIGKNKPTAAQSTFAHEINELGGRCVTAYSIDDVQKALYWGARPRWWNCRWDDDEE